MPTATARPDPNAPFARAEIIVDGLSRPPLTAQFQLRRSNVDYVEPNLDLHGWTRSEVVLLPLDAWWTQGRLHLLVSGLLCQFIDPGPLKLRLQGAEGAEIDLFWPEDIAVYDDGTLAEHARVQAETVRLVGETPPAPPPEPEPERQPEPEPEPQPEPPPAEPPPTPPQPSPWTPTPDPTPSPAPARRRSRLWLVLLVLALAAGIGGALNRIEERPTPQTSAPPPPISTLRPAEPAPRRAAAPPADGQPAMRTTLDRLIGDTQPPGRRADFDPFLSLRPTADIIGQTTSPEALMRYAVAKLDQHEPGAADRLLEEATRPRFGPAQNRPYPPAFVARALLYDPSVTHDLALPVPNAAFADNLYHRALATNDPDLTPIATRNLQRLQTWQTAHPSR